MATKNPTYTVKLKLDNSGLAAELKKVQETIKSALEKTFKESGKVLEKSLLEASKVLEKGIKIRFDKSELDNSFRSVKTEAEKSLKAVKVGVDKNLVSTELKAAIENIKFQKLKGLSIDGATLNGLKEDVENALEKSKVSPKAANSMLSALNKASNDAAKDLEKALGETKISQTQATATLSPLVKDAKSTGQKVGKEVGNGVSSSASKTGVDWGKAFQVSVLANLASSGISAGVGAIFAGAKGSFDAFVGFEDGMAGVTKTAGLTKQEVAALSDEILKIAPTTRSTIPELQTLAQIGGQFGVPKEELAGFTDEINKVNVALGDEFIGGAEEVATKMSTLKNLFGETKGIGYAEAMKKIGSAVNELGAAGTATGPEVAEFTNRIGQLGPALSPSITQVLGLGATFQELGLSAEISSSGMSNILLTAGKKSEVFAKQVGMSTGAFSEMMKKSPNEMLLKLADSFKDIADDPVKLAKKMKELNLDSQESIKVMSLLATNTDMVRQKQELAAKAYAEGTSVGKEYDAVNNTTAANLQKTANLIQASFIKIGTGIKNAFDNNETFKKFSGELQKIFEGVSKIDFQPIANNLVNALAGLAPILETASKAIQGIFKIGSGSMSGMIEGVSILKKLGLDEGQIKIASDLISGIKNHFKALGDAFQTLSTLVAPLSTFFIQFSTIIAQIVAGALPLFTAAFSGIVTLFTNIAQTVLPPLNNALKTFSDIFATQIAPKLQELVPIIQNLFKSLNDLWNVISPILIPVLNTLGTILAVVIGTAIMSFLDNLKKGGEALTGFVKWTTDAITSVKGYWDGFVGFITGFWTQVKSLWDAGLNTIKTLWSNVWESIKVVASTILLSLLAYIQGDTTKISTIWAQAGNKLKSIWSETWENVKRALSNAWTALSTTLNTLKEGVQNKMKEAGKAIEDSFNKAKNFLTNIDLAEAGRNIIQGLINGIVNKGSEVGGALKNIATNAITSFNNALKMQSPSRVFFQAGSFVGQGIVLGINSTANIINRAVNAMTGLVKKGTDDIENIKLEQAGKEKEINDLMAKNENDFKEKIKNLEDQKRAIKGKNTATQKANLTQQISDLRFAYNQEKELNQNNLEEVKKTGKAKVDSQKELNKQAEDNQKSYLERVKQANSILVDSQKAIDKENENYQKALEDKGKAIAGFSGLFDQFQIKFEGNGQSLISNLQTQVDALGTWSTQFQDLAKKGISDGLLKELQGMGPKALGEIQALNALTEPELQKYSELFEEKNRLAKEAASTQMREMEKQTGETVENIKLDAIEKLSQIQEQTPDLGKKAIQGLIDGIKSMAPALNQVMSDILAPKTQDQMDFAMNQKQNEGYRNQVAMMSNTTRNNSSVVNNNGNNKTVYNNIKANLSGGLDAEALAYQLNFNS